MRTIKFRAWDKDRKIMMYGIETAYDTLGSMTNREGNIEYDYYDSSFGSCLKNPDYEIMQFTGLHDKNGKEIYEGDVIKFYLCDVEDIEGSSEVIFRDGCFTITAKSDYWPCLDFVDVKYREVIGNIYENPELLEGGK